jgi:hypothetical protein
MKIRIEEREFAALVEPLREYRRLRWLSQAAIG